MLKERTIHVNILKKDLRDNVRRGRRQRDNFVRHAEMGIAAGFRRERIFMAVLRRNVRRIGIVDIRPASRVFHAAGRCGIATGDLCGVRRIRNNASDCGRVGGKSDIYSAGVLYSGRNVRVHGFVRIQDRQKPVVHGNVPVCRHAGIAADRTCVAYMADGGHDVDDLVGGRDTGVRIVHCV